MNIFQHSNTKTFLLNNSFGKVSCDACFYSRNTIAALYQRVLGAQVFHTAFCSAIRTPKGASHLVFHCLIRTANFFLAIFEKVFHIISFSLPKCFSSIERFILQGKDRSDYRHHQNLGFFRCLVGKTNFFSPCSMEPEQKEEFNSNGINASQNAPEGPSQRYTTSIWTAPTRACSVGGLPAEVRSLIGSWQNLPTSTAPN